MNNLSETKDPGTWEKYKWSISGALVCLIAAALWPIRFSATISFVVNGMIEVSPLVVPGIIVSAWVNASGAGDRIKQAFDGNQLKAILLASTIGAITPVCGVTVLPLMAGLLASGVPLAPVMAFWLSSPVTDPAMFSVTAATLGFHFAIAKTLAAAGAKVAVNDINPDRASRVAGEISHLGGQAIPVTADISNKFMCVHLVESTRAEWGQLDILINNAGVEPVSSILKMDEWDWDRCIDVNLKGTFFMSQL